MDEFDCPGDDTEKDVGWVTVLQLLIITGLSLFTGLTSLSALTQIGPEVGEMVVFDPRNGPRYWQEPGILALRVSTHGSPAPTQAACILMPSVMAVEGGSLVIEEKMTSQPPSFRVHWSGSRTERGVRDCGPSADLTLRLAQIRALANVAGGFGVHHWRGLY
jgi:hypothetical protein